MPPANPRPAPLPTRSPGFARCPYTPRCYTTAALIPSYVRAAAAGAVEKPCGERKREPPPFAHSPLLSPSQEGGTPWCGGLLCATRAPVLPPPTPKKTRDISLHFLSGPPPLAWSGSTMQWMHPASHPATLRLSPCRLFLINIERCTMRVHSPRPSTPDTTMARTLLTTTMPP